MKKIIYNCVIILGLLLGNHIIGETTKKVSVSNSNISFGMNSIQIEISINDINGPISGEKNISIYLLNKSKANFELELTYPPAAETSLTTSVWSENVNQTFENGYTSIVIGTANNKIEAEILATLSKPLLAFVIDKNPSDSINKNNTVTIPLYTTPYAFNSKLSQESLSVDWDNIQSKPTFEMLSIESVTTNKSFVNDELKANRFYLKINNQMVNVADVLKSLEQNTNAALDTSTIQGSISEQFIDNLVSNNQYFVYNENNDVTFNTLSTSDAELNQLKSDSATLNYVATKSIIFEEHTNTTTASSTLINWNTAVKQRLTINQDTNLIFSNPNGPSTLILVLDYQNDITQINWPNSVKWPGGAAISLTKKQGSKDIINFYYDGVDYLGIGILDFRSSQ